MILVYNTGTHFYTSIVHNTSIPVLWSPSTGDPTSIVYVKNRLSTKTTLLMVSLGFNFNRHVVDRTCQSQTKYVSGF